MGISKSAFKLLIDEIKKGNLPRGVVDVLQLGRQHTFITWDDATCLIKPLYEDFRGEIYEYGKVLNSRCVNNIIDDHTTFRFLGCKGKIESLDVSNYENATYIHDLNLPVPKELHNKYDIIFDGGTIEHIFDTPQVLENIHKMLKIGGVVIHCTPSHNHVDHGYYMYSPIFFTDYYHINKYERLNSYIFEYTSPYSPWKVYKYNPGCLHEMCMGGFGKPLLGIWLVVKKTKQSTFRVIPQQFDSTKKYNPNDPDDYTLPAMAVRNFLKRSKAVHETGKQIKKLYRRYTMRNRLEYLGKF